MKNINRSHHRTRFCSGSCATKKQYSEGKVAKSILARKGWKGVRNTGRTRFKKGQKPWNTKGYIKPIFEKKIEKIKEKKIREVKV